VLPSIGEECWVPAVQQPDGLLVWGGDPVFLAYWMRRSGLADVLPSLPSETVYLGVSAGSIAANSTFAETYREPRRGSGEALSTEDIVFESAARQRRRSSRSELTARGQPRSSAEPEDVAAPDGAQIAPFGGQAEDRVV